MNRLNLSRVAITGVGHDGIVGVEKIIEFPLDKDELKGIHRSAEVWRKTIRKVAQSQQIKCDNKKR